MFKGHVTDCKFCYKQQWYTGEESVSRTSCVLRNIFVCVDLTPCVGEYCFLCKFCHCQMMATPGGAISKISVEIE